MPPPRTLEDLEAEVTQLPLEVLLRRFHDCAAAGHVWLALDAPALTSRQAHTVRDVCGYGSGRRIIGPQNA